MVHYGIEPYDFQITVFNWLLYVVVGSKGCNVNIVDAIYNNNVHTRLVAWQNKNKILLSWEMLDNTQHNLWPIHWNIMNFIFLFWSHWFKKYKHLFTFSQFSRVYIGFRLLYLWYYITKKNLIHLSLYERQAN
jgi:hypothetical protein